MSGVTYSGSLIVPEVWQASIQAELKGRLVLAQFAHSFDGLTGKPGDVINLVEFERLSELEEDTAETETLVPEELASTDMPLVIVEASKAASISWRAKRVSYGDPVAEAVKETARVIAARVDTKLREAAEAAIDDTEAELPWNGPMSYQAVIRALEPFGDTVTNGGVSLLVNSHQWRSLMLDGDFRQMTRDGSVSGPGFVGMLGVNIPVFVSDRLTTIPGEGEGEEAEPDTHRALLFYDRPLAYAYKRDVETHMQDDILKRLTHVVSTLHYATGSHRPENIAALVTH
jgi:hypothetical protein